MVVPDGLEGTERKSEHGAVTVQFIGHASYLIRIGRHAFLTDPNFSDHLWFLKRMDSPGLHPEDLPELDAILLSHLHCGHFDLPSYKFFSLKTPIVVPQGLAKFVRRFLKNPIIEIAQWGTYHLQDLTLRAVPVRHFSGPFCRAKTGFVIEHPGAGHVFFCGDSAYGPHFNEIANLHRIDLALLPIGSDEPRWLFKRSRMNPAEALLAFRDLKAKKMVPHHWGSFKISMESKVPIEVLQHLINEKSYTDVEILLPGQTLHLQDLQA